MLKKKGLDRASERERVGGREGGRERERERERARARARERSYGQSTRDGDTNLKILATYF